MNNVSIHTPAKGATAYKAKLYGRDYVSIHTPAKGATFVIIGSTNNDWGFNPHTREGCDFWMYG